MTLLRSLHFRVGAVLVLMLFSLWASLWFESHKSAGDTATREIDQQLRQTAAGLVKISVHLRSRSRAEATDLARDIVRVVASAEGAKHPPDFLIHDTEARVIAGTPDFPLTVGHVELGFGSLVRNGERWRIFAVEDVASGLTVQVASRDAARQARADMLNRAFSTPLLWSLPVLVVIAAITLWHGLSPLRAIEKALAAQQPGHLQPLAIPRRRIPTELRRLVDTLDDLLLRIRDTLARQRAFAAGAAHELRTPLAACQSQAEVAERTDNPVVRQRAITQIQDTIERMGRLVAQLLALARARETEPNGVEPVDVDTIVRQAVEARYDGGEHREIKIALQLNAHDSRCRGNAELLRSLVDNLLDNAMRFSPDGGRIDIATVVRQRHIVLRVRDEGPGITDADRQRVFDAFVTTAHDNKGNRTGSGLGLSIVQAVAAYHGGTARLESENGAGTTAIVELPAT